MTTAKGRRSEQEIQDWMVAKLSTLLNMKSDAINVKTPITRYGVDSVRLVEVAADLEKWLGRKVDDEVLQDHPDIQSLAKHLAASS
jgi:acyl carrier protein